MADQGIAGLQGPLTPGSTGNLRLGNQGELVLSHAHARKYEGTFRGQRFGGAMQAVLATATIAGLSTSITGTSVLANPIGSGVNLVIERFGVGFVLAPAAPLIYGLATGFNATTALSGTLTSLSPKSKMIGNTTNPKGALYASAAITLPTAPTVDTVLGFVDTGAITTVTGVSAYYDLDGTIVLAPGGYAVFWTSAVLLASAHIASWDWEEVPTLG